MKIEDVEKWIETEEGKEWLDKKVEPLLNKKNELLGELVAVKKRLADATGKGNTLTEKMQTYLHKLKLQLIGDVLDGKGECKDQVFADADIREYVAGKIERMAEADGGLNPDIDDEGNFRFATADGKGFADYYREWTETEGAKNFIRNNCTGGGALGSANYDAFSKMAVKRMSPEEVAKNFDNPNFRTSVESAK